MIKTIYLFGILAATFGVYVDSQGNQHPLFTYETNPLTDDTLRSFLDASGLFVDDVLYAFDDERISTADRLRSGACKAFPGDANWPSQADWRVLHTLLGGALIKTVPLAAPCYQNLGVFSTEKCAAIGSNWTNGYLHENDPTSTFWPIYQGSTCLPTDDPGSRTCTLGAFPTYTVNVSSVRQIQLAVNFARNANLRLVVKNTGHCYLGKSSGAGALSIWTHNLKETAFYPQLSIPGYSGPALKIGAGVTVREVYQKAHQHGVSALGGICESVGYAGGYIAGGGHTPLSGLYGMAADHVMALEVVTADGRFVTASPEEHPDLFWALRGGGGGTYGVVTSIIIRVHPKLPVVTSVLSFSTSATVSADTFWEGLRVYFELFIPFTDAGTYSWWTLTPQDGGGFRFSMEPFFAPNHTIESFNALVKPWFDRLAALNIPIHPITTAHDAFYPAYSATWGSDVGLNSAGSSAFVPGNWLLPRGNWEDPTKFNATFAAIRTHCSAGRMLFGYHQAPRNRANADNAVSPAFRQLISMLVLSSGLPPDAGDHPTPAQIKSATDDLLYKVIAPFRAVAPESAGGGSYLNEANVDQPDWQAAFYGAPYQRLLGIKGKYDPRHVFYGPTAVGSEGWEVRDGEQGTQTQNGRLCRV
ncbi:hypothetical protein B0T25DRAFT_624894 [Lasiosphaeria hispida]|uniref:FAD-binding PCMH-type domain-containing protein n=1 Tax=Lasiosphaeria hispida TaxID=260671 RepID=A0AAJ0HC30_9PEZI|nr:hypothetical protein B0T25DRAFT_624894 [Lasiosphaeria hispida]